MNSEILKIKLEAVVGELPTSCINICNVNTLSESFVLVVRAGKRYSLLWTKTDLQTF